MNESLLDLLITLFDPATTDTKKPLKVSSQTISSLMEFEPEEVEQALDWLRLFRMPKMEGKCVRNQRKESIRVFTPEEYHHFTGEAWSYLQQIYQSGVIDMTMREHIIDCAMLIDTPEVTQKQIKWIALMTFIHQNAFESVRQQVTEIVDHISELHSE